MTSVMLICTASSIGGMERVVCSLARGLVARGVQVRTFFPESDNAHALLRWCEDQGVSAEAHPAVRDAAAPHSVASARALRRLVRDVDPDIVSVHYGDNFLSMFDVLGVRAAGLGRPFVATIYHPTGWTRASRRKRLMTALGARGTTGITTISDATRAVLRAAGVGDNHIHVIPCGVPIPDSPIARDDARRTLQISGESFVVSTLARLVEYKGIDELIKALDCEELAETVLLVGGDGPMRRELQEQANACSYVDARFLGRLPDVGMLFAASDLFALPSRLEGFGLVYVEAAMYGVPSVATRVGGVPDAVRDRETGILVDPHDARSLRDAIVTMKSNTEYRLNLGSAARQRAMHELDEETMVRRFESLFVQLSRRKHGSDLSDDEVSSRVDLFDLESAQMRNDA